MVLSKLSENTLEIPAHAVFSINTSSISGKVKHEPVVAIKPLDLEFIVITIGNNSNALHPALLSSY